MEEKNIDNKKSDGALREERILEFWKNEQIFSKTLSEREGQKEFVFYEGPPTANGKPGIHHLEARAFKDAIPRYKTMQGYYVRRKGGWDTHGLPVELQVEKKLGLNSKKAIEEYGIAEFNKECKESVWEYLDIWNKFTKRIGYWVDQENPYVTYHNDYIESVWNVLKKVNERKLLYKDYKVVPWCPRCGTALSSHELAQGYQDVKDLSVYAKFKLKKEEDENVYIVAWTTTPWTLPGNVALAVGKNIKYLWLKKDNEILIVAEDRKNVLGDGYEVVKSANGDKLVGLEYEPLYPYLSELNNNDEKLKNAYKIYDADFVTTTDGTGIVHTAVMYGQEDFELGTKVGLPKYHLVNEDGTFKEGTGFLTGLAVGDESTAVEIIKDLAHRGLLFKKEKYEHSYPFCWRCKTRLIYFARDSWYIKMSSLRNELVAENEKINWEPSHIKEGRFGEWIREVKDWAISRERYWGTPLPIWQKGEGEFEVIGSLEEIKRKTKKSGNDYYIMRHGETTHNVSNKVSTVINSGSHLTDKGKEQARESAAQLKDKGIELIITSPFNRTKETAKIVQDILGLKDDQVITDDRLHEMSVPMYEGRTWMEYHNDFPKTIENFDKAPEGNESYADIKRRMMHFIFNIEETYKNKKILIVTHGGPAWILIAGVKMLSTDATLELIRNSKDFHYLTNAEVQKLDFVPYPHDANYNLDFHRPYIDNLQLVSEDGKEMTRVKEVMDVWFDSGAMPFAQDHYPFENKEFIDGKGYPADYISEAIDQTRGWFYTLHAVGVLMERGRAYKNVICLGHILDKDGKKMSKSVGNVIDPWDMIEKYGVDTLRLWMYSVNQPGESKNFDEKTVAELNNKVFNLLYNVLAFFELYKDKEIGANSRLESKNILDQWILTKTDELINLSTKNLDNYKLLEPTRAIRDFIGDLSTWYLRRSRDRIKEGDKEAKETLYFVLKTIAKLLAPLAPFSAEDIYLRLKNEKDPISVHLCEWPEENKVNDQIIKDMIKAREIVTLGLEARQKAGIKVRQPLSKLVVKELELQNSYIEIIKDELNVKEVLENNLLEQDIDLDTHITLELRTEGQYRELVRSIQGMRKDKGLSPNDVITLVIETGIEGQDLITTYKEGLLQTVGAKEIKIAENTGTEIKIDDLVFMISIF